MSWNDFAVLADRVRGAVRASGWSPSALVAVGRGGLPFGVWLAHHLAIRPSGFFTVAACRNLSDDRFAARPSRPEVLWSAPLERLEGEAVLIVDDIAGDGETLAHVEGLVAQVEPASVRTAVLVKNAQGGATPNFCGRAVDEWVVFPWEG